MNICGAREATYGWVPHILQGMPGQTMSNEVGIEIGLLPLQQWAYNDTTILNFSMLSASSVGGLKLFSTGDPCVKPLQRSGQRPDFAYSAATIGVMAPQAAHRVFIVYRFRLRANGADIS
jgi:hypothetical protein